MPPGEWYLDFFLEKDDFTNPPRDPQSGLAPIFEKWIDDFQFWFGARWLFLSRGRGVRGAERIVKKLGEAAESATV